MTSAKLLIGAATLHLVGLQAAARAQCIVFEDPPDLFAHADIVFLGTVVSAEATGARGAHAIVETATLRVEQSWKGRPGRDVRVGADRPFARGTKYVVFAAGEPLSTSILCRWAEPADRARMKLEWLRTLQRVLPDGSPRQDPSQVSFPTRDGALIHADLYGGGTRGVVLAHGGRFNKESWREQVPALVSAGFRVLAIDFRDYGQAGAPASPAEDARHLDVIAAVEYLRGTGATTVSVVGASMGGDYAAEAAEAYPDRIDRLVLIAAGAYTPLVKASARKLFIMSRDDVIGDGAPRLPAIRAQYEKATGPKAFVVLDGSAHAQRLFETDQGERLMREILRFLSLP